MGESTVTLEKKEFDSMLTDAVSKAVGAAVEGKKAEDVKTAEAVEAQKVHDKEIADAAVKALLESMPADESGFKEKMVTLGISVKKEELGFGQFLLGVKHDNSKFLDDHFGVKRVAMEEKVVVSGTTTSGGYLVPEEWAQQLTRNIEDEAVARPHCLKKTMKSDTRLDPIVTSGVTAYFVGENTEKTKSDWTLGQIQHDARKLIALTSFSDEVLADSRPSASSIILQEFAIAIANKEDTDIFNGTGATPTGADPWTGIINLTSIVSKPMPGGGISFDPIFEALGQIRGNRAKKIVLFYHPTIEGLLRKIKGEDGQYLWANATGSTPNMIAGIPAISAINLPVTLGTANNETVIVLGDFSKNAELADRSGIVIAKGFCDEDFEYDRSSFRAVKRTSFKVHSSRENRFAKITGIVVPS